MRMVPSRRINHQYQSSCQTKSMVTGDLPERLQEPRQDVTRQKLVGSVHRSGSSRITSALSVRGEEGCVISIEESRTRIQHVLVRGRQSSDLGGAVPTCRTKWFTLQAGRRPQMGQYLLAVICHKFALLLQSWRLQAQQQASLLMLYLFFNGWSTVKAETASVATFKDIACN